MILMLNMKILLWVNFECELIFVLKLNVFSIKLVKECGEKVCVGIEKRIVNVFVEFIFKFKVSLNSVKIV